MSLAQDNRMAQIDDQMDALDHMKTNPMARILGNVNRPKYP